MPAKSGQNFGGAQWSIPSGPVAKLRPCSVCGKHFPSVVETETLCTQCETDSDFYKRTRKKGDKRQHIPYEELLTQWRAKRSEVRQWRKSANENFQHRFLREKAEKQYSIALQALTLLTDDPDRVIEGLQKQADLQATIQQQQREIELLKLGRDHLTGLLHAFRSTGLGAYGTTSIPLEHWRRLVQLAHPDKHEGSIASQEATRWLLANRPN